MSCNPFEFDSVVYSGYDYPPDGIGNHLSLLDQNIFQDISPNCKSLSSVLDSHASSVYGRVDTDLHLKHPDRFKNCLFIDVARETWNPELIKRQMRKTVHHKRVFNAVTAVYLMWESDELWDLYADMISSYDFCIVTSSLLDKYLTARGIDFVKLKHPYDYEMASQNKEPVQEHTHLRFGISAGLWSRKNVSLLAQQFEQVFGDDPTVQLSIHTRSDIANVDFKEELHKLRELQENNQRIELINKSFSRNDYLQWFGSLDVYCFVSSGEGYSVTPREALHLGIPVILHDAHVHREFSHLPGVVPVPSSGIQDAKINTSMYSYDIGKDWCVDENALRDALAYCRGNYIVLKQELTHRYHEILAYHNPASIKNEWVEALNKKYETYVDKVRTKYASVPEPPLESFPNLSNVDISLFRYQSNTGYLEEGRTLCLKMEHEPGHCLFGPDFLVSKHSLLTVVFDIDVFTSKLPECFANIDIYDNDGDRVLCSEQITRDMVAGVNNRFTMKTRAQPGQVLEFRVYWYGNVDMCVQVSSVTAH